jgi:hypothetical protein
MVGTRHFSGENGSRAGHVNTPPQRESFGQPPAAATQGSATPSFDTRGDPSVPTARTQPLSDTAFGTTPNDTPLHVTSTQSAQSAAAPPVPTNVEPLAAWSAHQPAESVTSVAPPSQNTTAIDVAATDATAPDTATTVTCPQCNAAVRKDQTFCMQCGARLAASSSSFGSPLE